MASSSVLDWLLTRDPERRLRLVNAGLALIMMILAVLVMHLWHWLGVVDGVGLWPWTIASIGGLAAMFLAIRSGWSRRMGDPYLALPQLLYAITSGAVAYRIAGQGHGASLLLVALVLMFGMFGLPRRLAGRVAAYTVVVFGIAMYSGAVGRPAIFDPRAQVGYFAAFVVFVCGFVAVNERIATIRRRVHVQKSALADALQRIHALATRDELTGLLNRRAMVELLDAEQQHADGTRLPWCIAILDVDHFKRINDRYGHAAGDEALRAVAAVCTGIIRSCDSVARWGGEEFVVLLREVDMPSAQAAAERIRATLESSAVRFEGATVELTVSIGVAAHVKAEDVASTLARADRALYEAKAAGRNRVLVG
jgi:diguanylate cyclase